MHCGGEFGVLREESVSGMDRVGTRSAGGRDELAAVEVAGGACQADGRVGLGDVWGRRIRLGVHGDCADTEAAAGVEHPSGDLPAVGDQYSYDHALFVLVTAISARLTHLSGRTRAEIVITS